MDTKNLLTLARMSALKTWAILEKQHGSMPFPDFALSNRFTKTAGCCYMADNRIVLGTKFLAQFPREMFEIIIPHELCHQVDFNKNGTPKNNRWHGSTWGKIMVNYGLPADTYHHLELKK